MLSVKRGIVVSMLLATAGCAGANYAMQNYSGIDPITWRSATVGSTFRIFDKPKENRLMITLGIGEAAMQGVGSGLTLGAADTRTPSILYQDAALEWLKTTGRTCTATNTFLVLEPQYEVRYNCAPAAPKVGQQPA